MRIRELRLADDVGAGPSNPEPRRHRCVREGIRAVSGNRSCDATVVHDMARATWNGVVIAESDDTVIVEGNHYFPRESLTAEVRESFKTTGCPWKGTANYLTLVVDGAENTDAIWYYAEPKDAAKEIAGRVAFWKGITVEA